MTRRRDLWAWTLPVLVAAVWGICSLRRSLWTDEFHSLHHVRAESWKDFLEAVRTDNHPPLSFALERISVGLFGEHELALRLPSLVAGTLFLWLLGAVPGLSRQVRRTATVVAAASSFSLVVFSEARMYGLVALAALGLVRSLLPMLAPPEALPQADRSPPRRSEVLSVALWTTVGLYSHYYFAHYVAVAVLVLGAMRVVLGTRGWGNAVLGGALGIAAWVPWVVYGLLPQLQREYPAGGHETGWKAVVQSFYHLCFMNTGFGGVRFALGVAVPATALAGGLAATSILRCRGSSEARCRGLGFAAALVVLVPVWAMIVAELVPKATFAWRYVAGSLGPVALLVGAGLEELRRRPLRRLMRGILVLALGAGSVLNAVHGDREDYRGAVRHVLAAAQPGDAVVVKPLWDPDPSGSPDGWTYYARRSEGPNPPPAVVPLSRLRDAFSYRRVWIFQRDPYSQYALEALRKHFQFEERWVHGLDLVLYLFSSQRGE